MTVTMKDIKTILEDLKTRKPPTKAMDSDQPLSNKEAIRHLASRLTKMKTRGFTTADLVEILKEHHLGIKGRDLNRYLNEYQKGTSNACTLHVSSSTEAPLSSESNKKGDGSSDTL